MKKILGLLITIILAISVCGCGDTESADVSTAAKTATEISSEQSSTDIKDSKTDVGKSDASSSVSYQSILDDYTQKLKDATPGLVEEYKTEASNKSGDTEALAALCNDKVEELAKICNDGVGEMAQLMNSNGDSYDTYEEWAKKLQDAYSDQASKIQDAYLDSATQ